MEKVCLFGEILIVLWQPPTTCLPKWRANCVLTIIPNLRKVLTLLKTIGLIYYFVSIKSVSNGLKIYHNFFCTLLLARSPVVVKSSGDIPWGRGHCPALWTLLVLHSVLSRMYFLSGVYFNGQGLLFILVLLPTVEFNARRSLLSFEDHSQSSINTGHWMGK